MGLVQAAKDTLESVLNDQWREYFYCDTLPDDILVSKAKVKNKKNNKGTDNVISDGSVVVVNEGQCMIIVEQGQVVDFCAQTGPYVFDSALEPSLLSGEMPDAETLKETFKAIGRRFSFGGSTGNDQRVYYFNIKEIKRNLFGTPQPIGFQVRDNEIGLSLSVKVPVNGSYSFKIVDPLLFYKNVSGNVSGDYRREEITGQMKDELVQALQPAISDLSKKGILHTEIPGYAYDVVKSLNENLKDLWRNERGIEIVSMTINPINISAAEEKLIQEQQLEWQKIKALRDPMDMLAYETRKRGDSWEAAANNTATGSMMAFAGLDLAKQRTSDSSVSPALMQMMAANGMMQVNAAQNSAPQNNAPVAGGWKCSCGNVNTANFCTNCGAKKPEANAWKCSCGQTNTGNFCPNCGAGKPVSAGGIKCDKCGWEPENPADRPKFCPNCGDVIDGSDMK